MHGNKTQELPVMKAIFEQVTEKNVKMCWNCNDQDLLPPGLEGNFNSVKKWFGDTVHVRELNVGDYPYQQLFNLFAGINYNGWILLEARTEPVDKNSCNERTASYIQPTRRQLEKRVNIKRVYIENIGEVTISRKSQAIRFKISIRPDGTIRATIPWIASFRSGEKFISEHLQWITQTKEKLAKKHVPQRLIQQGHIFSTRNYNYVVCPADIAGLRIRYSDKERDVFFEYPELKLIESDEIQKGLKLMIENVLRFDARQYLPRRITELAANLGYTYREGNY